MSGPTAGLTAAERRFGRPALKAPLDELVVSMSPATPVQESAAVVSTLLDRLHGGAADYTITVPEALLEQSRKTQRLFDIVMGAIAGISLLVGGIGIMNIMLATVLERTRDIGVRRAMGARQVDIRNQFVMGGLRGDGDRGPPRDRDGPGDRKGRGRLRGVEDDRDVLVDRAVGGGFGGSGPRLRQLPRDARRAPRPGRSSAVRVGFVTPRDARLPGPEGSATSLSSLERGAVEMRRFVESSRAWGDHAMEQAILTIYNRHTEA
jgi:hypothetical protein